MRNDMGKRIRRITLAAVLAIASSISLATITTTEETKADETVCYATNCQVDGEDCICCSPYEEDGIECRPCGSQDCEDQEEEG